MLCHECARGPATVVDPAPSRLGLSDAFFASASCTGSATAAGRPEIVTELPIFDVRREGADLDLVKGLVGSELHRSDLRLHVCKRPGIALLKRAESGLRTQLRLFNGQQNHEL